MTLPDKNARFEKSVDAALRNLPPRRAPASLEARVLAAIAAREARPWWRLSFVHWPAPVRVLFLVATATLAAGTVWLLLRALGATPLAEAGELISAPFAWWQESQAAARSLFELVHRSLSPTALAWIYAGIGIVGLCYATLVGAGAAAYRIFRRAR